MNEYGKTAVETAFSTITQPGPVFAPGHGQSSEAERAWAIIYINCENRIRRMAHCRCGTENECIHEINDLVQEAVLALHGAILKNRVINAPNAYLSRICLNIWLKAKKSIQRRQTQQVEYTEKPDDEAEFAQQSAYLAIADAIIRNGNMPLSESEIRAAVLKNLRTKRLTFSEVKMFLRYYRDEKKLRELSAFYNMTIAMISRLKKQVVLALRESMAP